MKVSGLEGGLLDYWVSRAEGYQFVRQDFGRIQVVRDGKHRLCHVSDPLMDHDYSPSTKWDLGGPIIEREEIGFHPMSDGKQWLATDYQIRQPHAYGQGPTPLVAAMRCYVALKYGEEVPDQESQ